MVEKGSCNLGLEVCRTGVVERTPVSDILLDTGCSRTLVRRDLVPTENLKTMWWHSQLSIGRGPH